MGLPRISRTWARTATRRLSLWLVGLLLLSVGPLSGHCGVGHAAGARAVVAQHMSDGGSHAMISPTTEEGGAAQHMPATSHDGETHDGCDLCGLSCHCVATLLQAVELDAVDRVSSLPLQQSALLATATAPLPRPPDPT